VSTPDPGDLPIADYDQIPPGELEHRIRSLSRPELEDLLEYERQHASRVQVLEMLTARLDQLRKGSAPSEGGAAPAAPGSTPHGSPVSPATAAEPGHPPPHGTADQPGKLRDKRP
jgi:hypothetical protein